MALLRYHHHSLRVLELYGIYVKLKSTHLLPLLTDWHRWKRILLLTHALQLRQI